jgi:hypothetical protein
MLKLPQPILQLQLSLAAPLTYPSVTLAADAICAAVAPARLLLLLGNHHGFEAFDWLNHIPGMAYPEEGRVVHDLLEHRPWIRRRRRR